MLTGERKRCEDKNIAETTELTVEDLIISRISHVYYLASIYEILENLKNLQT